MPFRLEENEEGCIFKVRVVPRASANRVSGAYGDAIKICVTASPVQGAANKALLKFLAHQLGVRSYDIEILAGHSSRTKRIRVSGITTEKIRSSLLP
ncbi:MAG: DUF167 domain-containing protein [Anaerolineae bacterium]|nr:DUF167 domain-containing protein [Anaerolineae bacterium]